MCCNLPIPLHYILIFLQLIPLPSCTAVSAGSFWRELFTPSSSHRATLKQANATTTLGKAVLQYQGALALYSPQLMCFLTVWCELKIYSVNFSLLFPALLLIQGVFQCPGVPPVTEQLYRGLSLLSSSLLNSSQSHHHSR